MRIKGIFAGMALVVSVLFGYADVKAQSLFDEMIVDGETVVVDSVAAAREEALHQQAISAVRARELRARRAAMRRAGTDSPLWDLTDAEGNLLDPDNFGPQELEVDTTLYVDDLLLPDMAFLPLIFSGYSLRLPEEKINPLNPDGAVPEDMDWADRAVYRSTRARVFEQEFMVANPSLVRYNLDHMPRPPKEFRMEADPSQAKITVTEFTKDQQEMKEVAKPVEIKRIHWLQNFDGSLHFSQAYVSPNWYQGGKSNFNAILNLYYNIKLNEKFHPNISFETTFQYRLGMNNAPDDTIHAYNITEDLFQVNTRFGVKAFKRWSYTVTGQFKTQLLNNYNINSTNPRSSFLSPGELIVGVGMTYAYTNPKNTLTFNASISPLSYNMKMCTSTRINPQNFGIEAGHTTISTYGSSTDCTLNWRMAYNITYSSRLNMFTNYEYLQGDWQNTITFTINKFLSTSIFANLRYQSDALPREDTQWCKWQLKEILSIGFTYKFSRS